jgi:peptidoglycan hydrolase FlgJ
MDVSPIQRSITASDIPPERLAGNSQLTEKQKVAEAARQFEAILLRQILENTQKTVIHSDYSDESTTASIYRDLVTNQLADSISKSGTFGLAKTLERQFTRQLSALAGHERNMEALPTARPDSDVARPAFGSAPLHRLPPAPTKEVAF